MPKIVQLTLKSNPGDFEKLEKLLSDALSVTVKANGNLHVSCACDRATHEFRVWEIWEDAETLQNYGRWRSDRGDFDRIEKLIAAPPIVEEFECLTA